MSGENRVDEESRDFVREAIGILLPNPLAQPATDPERSRPWTIDQAETATTSGSFFPRKPSDWHRAMVLTSGE